MPKEQHRHIDRDQALRRMMALNDSLEHIGDIAGYISDLEHDLDTALGKVAELEREVNALRAGASWFGLGEGREAPEPTGEYVYPVTTGGSDTVKRAQERHRRRHGLWPGKE